MTYYHIPVWKRFSFVNNRLFQRTLRKLLPKYRRGRRGYDKLRLLLWLMYRQCMNSTYRDIEHLSGIHHSTFIKYKKRMERDGVLGYLFTSLRDKAISKRKLTVVCDSSFVETYSGHDEDGSGYSGHKEANGYKLHQFIDFETRIPLLFATSPGQMSDYKGCEHLLDLSPPEWNVSAFLADKGYDSEALVHSIAELWGKQVKIAIPVRHMGGNALNHYSKYGGRTRDPNLYRKRTEIERYFSRKKHVFNLGEEKTRHLSNFQTNCALTAVMELGEWLARHEEAFT